MTQRERTLDYVACLTVRIKVSADDGADPDHRIVHNVLDFAKGAVDAEIAKPGDGVVARRSGDDVEITVPVNVSKMDSLRTCRAREKL
eukprot:6213932-Pleurochrysis_carterae.AAC.1